MKSNSFRETIESSRAFDSRLHILQKTERHKPELVGGTMHAPDAAFWSAARKQMMLEPDVTMLNTGSFGPLPRPVFDRVTELRSLLAAGPTNFIIRRLPPLLWESRLRQAQLFGTDPTRLIFFDNVTAATNLLASGLVPGHSGEILLTDQEYLSLHWCWQRAARERGLTFRTFSLPVNVRDPGEIVEAFVQAFRPQTRLVFFSHVLCTTGLIVPAREICAAARERGILSIVDGAHAPAVVPLDVDRIGADFYIGNSHKWLLAPMSSAFMVIRPGNETRVRPLIVSWGYPVDPHVPDVPDAMGSTPRIRSFELLGTRDPCPWLTVPTAIGFQDELGFEAIRRRMRYLADYVRQRLEPTGLELLTPAGENLSGPMVAFRMPSGWTADELRTRLWEHRIEINPIERPGGLLLLRVSTHWYNTTEEVDRLAEVLPTVLQR